MDTQTVPFQPGVLLRGGQLSVSVTKITFFLLSLLFLLIQFHVYPHLNLDDNMVQKSHLAWARVTKWKNKVATSLKCSITVMEHLRLVATTSVTLLPFQLGVILCSH